LFLSIVSVILGDRAETPFEVVGGLGAGVEVKLKTGILSTLSWGNPPGKFGGEGGGSVLVRSTFCRADSVTLVLTLKLDLALPKPSVPSSLGAKSGGLELKLVAGWVTGILACGGGGCLSAAAGGGVEDLSLAELRPDLAKLGL